MSDLRASMLLARWCMVATLVMSLAGCGKQQRDALIFRNGTQLQGALAGCDAQSCTLDANSFPRAAIEWIGLASGDSPPPKVEHPQTDEEHMRDGSLRSAQLLSIDAAAVVVAAASLPRAEVAFVRLAGPAGSVPAAGQPSQADAAKASARVLHYSVRIEAHATHYNEGNMGLPSHFLHDTKVDWTGVWHDVAVEVNEASQRIDDFHAPGTPWPDAGEVASGEITASLAYHMIFPTAPAGRSISHECQGGLTDRVYPARLQISGSTKPGDIRFDVNVWPPLPNGASDPELLARKAQDSDRDCQITDPGWPAQRTFSISPDLEFNISPSTLGLDVRRERAPELFSPLDAIFADRSFTLDTGPQREEKPPSGGYRDETKDEWRAKIEFTSLEGAAGSGSTPDCSAGALSTLASIRDQNCSALQGAKARCSRDASQCSEQEGGLDRACDNATAEYQERSAACASQR